ncbi:hypothetical protein HNP46_002898 [Pseudomonas nitritireducens]|uniref:Uncharacterized protein n=1 Tax=Pseudomonas nitroreducens TaxID=46680 RepID=A0A7W7P0P9_PSENT|nr:hypothetical protein [Pseudomonas nitritireducens]MBB4864038.1 hypothetical protein [Pseudomonas nitritireducens]
MKYNFANGLVLSSDGQGWSVEGGGNVFQLKSLEDYRRVVSLLEKTFEEAEKELGPEFFYSGVILAGLNSKSEYWIDLALLWAADSGLGVDADINHKLSELIAHDQLSQSARNKAKTLISQNK